MILVFKQLATSRAQIDFTVVAYLQTKNRVCIGIYKCKMQHFTLMYVSNTPPLLSLGFLKVKSGSLPPVAFKAFSSNFLDLIDCLVSVMSLNLI